MTAPFVARHRVEFRDTDAAGIMHFSAFLTYMEESEHELLRSVGLNVLKCEVDGLRISWPRVSVHCDYRSPLRFDDEFEVRVTIGKLGGKSVQYQFDFIRNVSEANSGDEVVATGSITAACCRMEPTGMEAMPVPEGIRNRLAPFLKI